MNFSIKNTDIFSKFVNMEIWKDIKENSNYRISNEGRVLSVRKNIILKNRENINWYLSVIINYKGSVKEVKIHRLVAKAFVENEFNKKCVNHIDGNKKNNNYKNLEWCTHKENSIHAHKNKLTSFNEKCRENSKIYNSINKQASRKVFCETNKKTYKSIKEASLDLGVKMKTLSAQITGQNKNKYKITYLNN